MYDHLVGEVVEKLGARAVLRVRDVGFELKVSLTTADALPPGATVTVYTLLHVVDGMPSLLGFATRSERELARKLLATSGVGPSLALSVLSVYTPAEVVQAITGNDVAALKRVKGVGQKTAERLCLELRDSVQKLAAATADADARTVVLPRQSDEDAVLALLTLGYSEKEARDKLAKVRGRQDLAAAATEELVKAVLQL